MKEEIRLRTRVSSVLTKIRKSNWTTFIATGSLSINFISSWEYTGPMFCTEVIFKALLPASETLWMNDLHMSCQVILPCETCLCILTAYRCAEIPVLCFMNSIDMPFKISCRAKILVARWTFLGLCMVSHMMTKIWVNFSGARGEKETHLYSLWLEKVRGQPDSAQGMIVTDSGVVISRSKAKFESTTAPNSCGPVFQTFVFIHVVRRCSQFLFVWRRAPDVAGVRR